MKKLVATFIAFASLSAFGQEHPDFKIYALEKRFGPKTLDYFSKSDRFVYRKADVDYISQGGLVYKTDDTNFDPVTIKRMLDKWVPDVQSNKMFLLNWEAGPFHDLKNYPATDERFKVAEAKLIGLVAEVRKQRPNLRLSIYGIPYRAWKQSQANVGNQDNKLETLLSKLDYISPSVYILYTDERVGRERNIEYLNLNLDMALAYGKKLKRPVIPYVWHLVHPNDKVYGYQVLQKEVFASYIKHIKNYAHDGYRSAGVNWWVDSVENLNAVGVGDWFKGGTVYDAATYDTMMLSLAKETIKQLTDDNKAPVANAGSARSLTLPTSSVTLAGSGTDADGTVTGYTWSQVGGPGTAVIANGGTATATVSQLAAGTYVFSLKVKDNQGAYSAPAQVTVTVSPVANKPPVANAGPGKTLTLPVNSVALNGSGSDADGTVVGYAWKRVSGPGGSSFSNAGVAAPVVSQLEAGSHVFSLTVKDNRGATSPASLVNVVVKPAANKVPVAQAGGNKVITAPASSVALTGSGSDADGTISGYRWHQVSGPSAAAFSSTAVAAPTLSRLVTGDYLFSLTVTDNQGATSAASQASVTVQPAVVDSQAVVSYTLMNADTDQEIMTLVNGATLDLSTLPTRRLNIRANTRPAKVGSVVLSLDGRQTRRWTESTAPYALFSNDGSDYKAWTPPAGSYTLTGVPHGARGAAGPVGTALSVTFTVKN